MNQTTKNGDPHMTTPKVTEIRRQTQPLNPIATIEEVRAAAVASLAHIDLRAHGLAPLRHNYDALTPVDMDAYRRRCAEIRTLDERADRAREV